MLAEPDGVIGAGYQIEMRKLRLNELGNGAVGRYPYLAMLF